MSESNQIQVIGVTATPSWLTARKDGDFITNIRLYINNPGQDIPLPINIEIENKTLRHIFIGDLKTGVNVQITGQLRYDVFNQRHYILANMIKIL